MTTSSPYRETEWQHHQAFFQTHSLKDVLNSRTEQAESVRVTNKDKARATTHARRHPIQAKKTPSHPIGGHGGTTRRPQARRPHLPFPPAPPPLPRRRRPRAAAPPEAWSGGGVHGAEPELAGGHRGATRRGAPRCGARGAHPERRGRRWRRHHRLRRVPPPRQQEVHRHGLPGLLRLQRAPRQAGGSLLRPAVLLARRRRRRAAQDRGDLGRRGAPPHFQRHRVRGGDLHRYDEGGKRETSEAEGSSAADLDGDAGGEGPGGHLRVLLRAGHGGRRRREAPPHDTQRGVPVRREAGGREDGGVHGEAGGLWRAEAGREDRVQGGPAAAAQGPRVSQAEQAGLVMSIIFAWKFLS